MNELAEHLPAASKTVHRTNPLLRLWISLGADLFWLVDMTRGAITCDEIDAWESGRPIPSDQRVLVAGALRTLLDSGETLLGREAVRNPKFATSPQFFMWSKRLNKARRQFEALEASYVQ